METLILERLKKWKEGKTAGPFRATLIITNWCNLDCLFCRGRFRPREKKFYKYELSTKEWVRVAKEGLALGIKEWDITGGEPLAKSGIVVSIINLIKKADINTKVTLITNGTLLHKKVAENLVRAKCDVIEVGIDGPNAKIHDFLRGKKGSFKRAINAIKFLSKTKKKLKEDKPFIILKTVLNAKNCEKLDELVFLTSSVGADCFKITPMRIYDENVELINKTKLRMNERQRKKIYENWGRIEEIGKKLNIKIEKEFSFGKEEVSTTMPFKGEVIKKLEPSFLPFCYIPFYSLVIDGKGNVGPCSSIPPTEFVDVPNIREESLKKIWYGNFFNSVRKCLLSGKPMSEKCKNCGLLMEKENIEKEIFEIFKESR
jgi:radical SAM protein with 4Fe4S-binding SPASM domain